MSHVRKPLRRYHLPEAPALHQYLAVRFQFFLALTCVMATISCGGGSQPLSPSPLGPVAAPRSNVVVGFAEGDDPTMPQPAPAPVVPAPIAISIIGSIGPGAFMPNPMSAVVGNAVMFANSDTVTHRIVLDDDGTVLANLAPGESSTPIALTRTTTRFHCAIHPSMTGSIQDPSVPPTEPPPYVRPDPPDYGNPPPGDGYY